MRLADGDYWVDDYGSWNHVAFGQLCPFFPDPVVRNRQAVDFAFRRLGMVRVCKVSRTITLQWDIAEACDESLNSACAFLWELRGIRRIKLRFYYGGWTQEVFDSVREALIRLEILRSYRHVTPFPGARRSPIGEEQIETVATATIRRTRKLLAENAGLFDDQLRKGLAEENLLERILLFREEDGGSWLSYRYIGQHSLFSQVFGTGVSKDLIGKHYALDPRTNRKSCILCRTYPQVLASGKEHFDHIFVPIKLKNDDGIWVSYQRMLTACQDRKGQRMLLLMADSTQENLIAA